MPGGDGTGPLGAGPMTGRGMGNCTGSAGPGFGRGCGRGGRGWRHWYRVTGLPGWMRFGGAGAPFAAAPGADAEKQMLREQAQALQAQLDMLKMRLDRMGADEPAK